MKTCLTREYRFFLRTAADYSVKGNAWSGAASGWSIAPFFALRATVSGPVDPLTGYLINIQDIDRALAGFVQRVYAARPAAQWTYPEMIRAAAQLAQAFADPIELLQVELVVSPFMSFQLVLKDPPMLTFTQEFEFSAAHRLDCPALTPTENQQYFGKCNHPNGHGHNYVVAVTVACGDGEFPVTEFEAALKRLVIDRFDHKHLNLDLPEFASVNPSVEHIAKVIWQLLSDEPLLAGLVNVRVYETPKTWADYSAR